jgi:DNA-binding XRE family transcriptional regulator
MKENLSRNLKFLRKQAGKSQSELGLQLNKAHTSIGNWEKGIAEPSLSEIESIARIFEIQPEELLFTDLENVHLRPNAEFPSDVHLSVHPTVHLKGKKRGTVETGSINTEALSRTTKLGRAEMPKVVTIDTAGDENIVFVPVKARAGYLLGYGDPEYLEKLPARSEPEYRNGTYRMFEVQGVSMFPTLQDKDRAIARWTPVSEILEDRIHVLVTRNEGILIKRVLNRSKEGVLICKSDNIEKNQHPTVILNVDDVVEAWYVVERRTRQLPGPAEFYKRVTDLEGEIALIKAALKNSSIKL